MTTAYPSITPHTTAVPQTNAAAQRPESDFYAGQAPRLFGRRLSRTADQLRAAWDCQGTHQASSGAPA